MSQTVFVEANLTGAKLDGADSAGAHLKYAKLEGTPWANSS
jgi:uncharacterized protein YjbI with pentapeptide repeats